MTQIRFSVSIASATLLFALLACAPPFLGAQTAKIKVESSVMPANKTKGGDNTIPSLKLDIANIQISRRILLEPMAESAQSAGTQIAKNGPLQVGIGRHIPSPYSDKVELAGLEWIQLTGGGKAAALTVTSPDAAALRLGLTVTAISDGIEIRFFSMETPKTVFGPYNSKELLPSSDIRQADLFWSPVMEGDTIGMEIFLPEGRSPEELSFSIPKVSHLWKSIAKQMSDLRPAQKRLCSIGDSGSCEFDIACLPDAIPTGNSVAELIYTSSSDGESWQCTGTLMNDTVSGTYVPYFLTAGHCIGNQSEATSADLYWFYQRSSCMGPNPTSVKHQTGGATLLSRNAWVDHSFMKLNSSPPEGVVFSEWSLDWILPLQSVSTIHHPQGDVKKLSLGHAGGYAFLGGSDNDTENFITVQWFLGVTEKGSSGAGLLMGDKLVGVLRGGASSCDNLSGIDKYGRFDRIYSCISQWIDPAKTGAELQNGVPVTDISSVDGSNLNYYISLPFGVRALTVTVDSGIDRLVSGSVRRYDFWGTNVFDDMPPNYCKSYSEGRIETCTYINPAPCNWYIVLYPGMGPNPGSSLTVSYMGNYTNNNDFDGDGKIDVAIWRPDSGVWFVLPSNSPGTYIGTQWGVASDIPVHSDYDGDGKEDIAIWRPDSGVWFVLPSNSPGTYIVTQWGVASDIPVHGDYDRDGKEDIAVWRPDSGIWYVLPSGSPGTYTAMQWGLNTDIPVPGEYDGDGRTDIAVWRPSTGVWYMLPSGFPGTYTTAQWGLPTDKPVPDDYDGDGKIDIAVWRPDSGIWYVLPSASPGTYTGTRWGLASDIPAPGDFDGDRIMDIAVWRSSNGVWYILPSNSPGTYTATQWGLGSDVPISSLTGILRSLP